MQKEDIIRIHEPMTVSELKAGKDAMHIHIERALLVSEMRGIAIQLILGKPEDLPALSLSLMEQSQKFKEYAEKRDKFFEEHSA